MASLPPEMIEGMPGPFRGMTKVVKSSPGHLRDAMIARTKPMIPSLFPMLMPGMMPKMMPDILQAVGRRIPMLESIEEQMPDLMPPAVENPLPKMLPEVIPYSMPHMEACLKREASNGRQESDARPQKAMRGRAFQPRSCFARTEYDS